ncbi:hypothetical protein LOAG_06101 [Loa loa]|uniref:Uncharacterized protein n=1 Tax=Loa loa TaxID=7209 RepID=A0A1I7VMD5_LOALO|nr:hypothetical protein LOAG_06101 [Loa loa]EFO22382.1 hypothetical protein LOAG_06101 [Loa loa]
MQSFDIESLIGTGRERSNGCSGISEKTTETEAAKEVALIKATATKDFPDAAANTTKVSTSASPNFDRNLIKSEFLSGSASSRLRPEASTVCANRTVYSESKCSSTAFHAYPCISDSKSQCAPSSPSVSG